MKKKWIDSQIIFDEADKVLEATERKFSIENYDEEMNRRKLALKSASMIRQIKLTFNDLFIL